MFFKRETVKIHHGIPASTRERSADILILPGQGQLLECRKSHQMEESIRRDSTGLLIR